jgi:hypothetical protein
MRAMPKRWRDVGSAPARARCGRVASKRGYRVADVLRTPTICVDVLRSAGKPLIAELSYHYESRLLRACHGHWRREGETLQWIDEKLLPEDAILDDFLARLTSFRNKS